MLLYRPHRNRAGCGFDGKGLMDREKSVVGATSGRVCPARHSRVAPNPAGGSGDAGGIQTFSFGLGPCLIEDESNWFIEGG